MNAVPDQGIIHRWKAEIADFSFGRRASEEQSDAMNQRLELAPQNMSVVFGELEEECLTAIRFIEALKVPDLSEDQRESILGELSASITHLRMQTELLDVQLENIGES